jgi:hypothetical protein
MWFSKPLTIKVEGDVMTLEYLRYRTVLNRRTRLVSVQKEYPCSSSMCPCWHSAVEMQSAVAFVYMDSKPVAYHWGDDRKQRQPRHQYGGRLLIINQSQVYKCPLPTHYCSCHCCFTMFVLNCKAHSKI